MWYYIIVYVNMILFSFKIKNFIKYALISILTKINKANIIYKIL